jgi:hypothetical protein
MNRTYDLSPLFILKCNFATIVFGKKDTKMSNQKQLSKEGQTKQWAKKKIK